MWLSEITFTEDTCTLSAARMLARTLVFGYISFMQIFSGALWRGAVKGQWVVENGDLFGAFGRCVFGTFRDKACIIV